MRMSKPNIQVYPIRKVGFVIKKKVGFVIKKVGFVIKCTSQGTDQYMDGYTL